MGRGVRVEDFPSEGSRGDEEDQSARSVVVIQGSTAEAGADRSGGDEGRGIIHSNASANEEKSVDVERDRRKDQERQPFFAVVSKAGLGFAFFVFIISVFVLDVVLLPIEIIFFLVVSPFVDTERRVSPGELLGQTARPFRLIREVLKPLIGSTDDRQNLAYAVLFDLFSTTLPSGRARLSYASYPPHPEFPDTDLSGMMKMLDGQPPAEYIFRFGKVATLLRRVVFSQLAVSREPNLDKNAKSGKPGASFRRFLRPMKKGFISLPSPMLAKNYRLLEWRTNKEFARQFIAGLNPVMIERVQGLDQLQDRTQGATIKHFGEAHLQELIAQKNLYMVDYGSLGNLPTQAHRALGIKDSDTFYFESPFVLLSVNQPHSNDLYPMAIQMKRSEDAIVYTPNAFETHEQEWRNARMYVRNADVQIHEWVTHLGKSHLTIEPHAIAAHNHLKGRDDPAHDHPLYVLLKPHFKDTLFLNWLARRTLVKYTPGNIKSVNSVADEAFSIGCGQCLQLINDYWKGYSFFDYALPNELESRGFHPENDPLGGYCYLTDGMKIWNAIRNYTSSAVNEVFSTDADVANDKRVQDWAEETADPDRAAVKGFPPSIQDRDTLALILATLIWTASGFHAAINFPQYDYMGFLPNRPTTLRKPFHKDTRADDPELLRDFLPLSETIKTINQITYVLTTPSDHTLGDLAREVGPNFRASYSAFVAELGEIRIAIEQRNEDLKANGSLPYNYLNPVNIPASIDI